MPAGFGSGACGVAEKGDSLAGETEKNSTTLKSKSPTSDRDRAF